MPGPDTRDVIRASGRPLCFRADEAPAARLGAPDPATVSCRMLAWPLSGYQKVGVIRSAATGAAWRLVSDEGPNLQGHDAAPPPLGFLSVGLAQAYADALVARAAERGVTPERLTVRVDNYYSVTGSMRGKDMVGGALPFRVTIDIGPGLSQAEASELAWDAVRASAVSGFALGRSEGAFRAILNGAPLDLPGLPAFDETAPGFVLATGDGEAPSMRMPLLAAAGWSQQSGDDHPIHVSAELEAAPGEAGTVRQELNAPNGSAWQFRSDGLEARAPDAATLVSAGIGFCFMTQLEILASLHRVALDSLVVMQDSDFGPPGAPDFAPLRTTVAIGSNEAPDTIRELVVLAQRACYLHGFAKTALKPRIRVNATPQGGGPAPSGPAPRGAGPILGG